MIPLRGLASWFPHLNIMTENTWSITAHSTWWSQVTTALSLCSEKAQSGGGSSFLSCVYIVVSNDEVTLTSESSGAGFSITTSDVEFSGSGDNLVPVQAFKHALSSLPAGGDIVVGNTNGDITVATDDGSASFTVVPNVIVDHDMVPHPPHIPDNLKTADVDSADMVAMYRTGSAMAQDIIGSEHVGYDPLSGCVVTLDHTGIQMISLATSSSESHLVCDTGMEDKDDPVSTVTIPSTTLPCLRAVSAFDSVMECGVAPSGNFVVSAGGATISIVPLNVAANSKSAVTYKNILNVFEPVWKNRYVTVEVSSRELFAAVGRAAGVSDDRINVIIADSQVTIQGVDPVMSGVPFTQDIACHTQWHNQNGQHTMEFSISPDVFKKVGSMIGGKDTVTMSVSYSPTNTPWAVTLYGEDFDDNDPHNFFLLGIETKK